MPPRLTQEEFIRAAQKVHGNKFDYSKFVYAGMKVPSTVVCHQHGDLLISPSNHLYGSGCSRCGIEQRTKLRTKTKSQFVADAQKLHGSATYDYSQVEYKNAMTKVKILCRTHGVFVQPPNSHLSGNGCPDCGDEKTAAALRSTTEEFITKARKVWGERWDYCKVVYKGARAKIEIICPTHKSFWQDPNNHLSGTGCMLCRNKLISAVQRKSAEEFISDACKVHGERYDYSQTKYVGTLDLVTIVCKTHGAFEQRPRGHLSGAGCPHCAASRGEKAVRKFLEANRISFQPEVRIIPGTRFSFDFLLPDRGILIEFHGEQHYFVVDFSSRNPLRAKKAFLAGQKRDRFKAQWAAENGYELIVIPYWDLSNVEKILSERLLTLKKAA